MFSSQAQVRCTERCKKSVVPPLVFLYLLLTPPSGCLLQHLTAASEAFMFLYVLLVPVNSLSPVVRELKMHI